jgi:uncharacterized protein YidB (DUF937 family)
MSWALAGRWAHEEVTMGLVDVLNGMQNGPRGPSTPGGGGMSPITMALLGLLAYKAIKTFNQPGASTTGNAPARPGTSAAPGGAPGPAPGGGLGGLLSGGLGSLLGGAAAGGALTSGLNDLLKQFEQSGQGDVASSWVGNGPNKSISPNDLSKALGADQINTLMAHTGLSRDALLQGLSQHLPDAINHLTPQGRVPTEQEAARML